MSIKSTIATLIAAAALAVAPVIARAQGVPVIDAAKLLQDQSNQAANIAKYVEMVAQSKVQIEQLKAQREALTGKRMLGNLLNDPAYASYLPKEWRDVYNSVQNGGYQGLTGTAKALRDANQVFDVCNYRKEHVRIQCTNMGDKAAIDAALASDAYDMATERWDQIQGLLGAIDHTTDPKAIAELGARIQGEVAALQNEQTKLQMMSMVAAAHDKMLEQADRERTVQSILQEKPIHLTPVRLRTK